MTNHEEGNTNRTIWILNHYAVPDDVPGGTRHFEFAKELSKRGYSVRIFASSFSHVYRDSARQKVEPGQRIKKEEVAGVTFFWLRTFPYRKNDWRRIVNMLSFAYRAILLGFHLKETPTSIIGSCVHPFAVLAAYLLAKRKKARFIFEVRDLWPQTLVDLGEISEHHVVTRFLRKLEVFLYRHANQVIVLQAGASEYIMKFGIPAQRITWIPNGVNLNGTVAELPPDLDESIRQLKAGGTFLAAYAGSHGVADGLSTILEAADILKKQGNSTIRVLLVGDGPEKLNLQKMANDLKLDNVSFYSPISKKCIPRFLSHMNVLIVHAKKTPILKYGLSFNKLFDYLAAGKPIILAVETSLSSMGDLVNCTRVIPPDNAEILADTLGELSTLPVKELEKLGREARILAEKDYSISILVDKLVQCL